MEKNDFMEKIFTYHITLSSTHVLFCWQVTLPLTIYAYAN